MHDETTTDGICLSCESTNKKVGKSRGHAAKAATTKAGVPQKPGSGLATTHLTPMNHPQ